MVFESTENSLTLSDAKRRLGNKICLHFYTKFIVKIIFYLPFKKICIERLQHIQFFFYFS